MDKIDLAVDCIDRQATLDAIIKRLGIKNEKYLLEAERVIYQQILAMPSVTPQEPKIVPIAEIKCDEDKLKELVNKAVLTVTPLEPITENCEQEPILDKIRAEIDSLERFEIRGEKTPLINGDNVLHILDKYRVDNNIKKRKPCINCEDGCEEWVGCPCVYYKAESEET